ncbi:hypothetical protein LX32DRAFT_699683 [Colletotrichum zoysiae]|uniref:CBM21 domain-containing protein n=1 Tax=Colletotrichum zoysiae TaxID=1216348 RepID=A0AAD9LTW0_9PEZI|nr:hypothetical protein LX32DRAFT_699683 [Colletotrichum zoysiae]
MPYTPPSHSRSPASSAPSSPDMSRRSSFQSSPRPSLPRSASYLTKHRRTPAAAAATDAPTNTSDQPTPPGTSDDLKSMATSSSVRQSPPPLTDERGMPKGAIISPPDSGSEEEDVAERGRQIENLKELQEAISQIPVRREASPTRSKLEQPALALITNDDLPKEGLPTSFSTSSLDALAKTVARRVNHTRSSTEPRIVYEPVSTTGSESDSDGNNNVDSKPPMVRKKSGELVRPALRPASARRRPSSMPGTPTFSKAVHFDSHLEHVRHFLQVDRPLAVSAGSSPVDNYDSDTEYPFPGDERRGARTPPFEWEIVVANQPVETPIRKSLPVRLERVWLSPDQKNLLGSVAVANLAFQKSVTCRFTLDYWKTTSEVAAEYSHEVRPQEGLVSQDRFTFTIKLSDLANLETKTLFFCVKYSVNGQEFWDNNNGTNFQVDFRKKHLPQNGKRGLQGAASRPALPRSNRRSSPASAPRPKSMPIGFDDFPSQSKLNFEQPIHEYLGESGPTGLRLKVNKSTGNLASDNLPSRLSAPSGQAFANRYDFGASLTAAVQAAKDTIVKDRNPDGLYMKSHRQIQVPAQQPQQPRQTKAAPAPAATRSAPAVPKPDVRPTVPGTNSPNTILASSSYEELVNKYCFFGSKQSSPQIKDGTLRSGKFDGADDGFATRASNSTSSSSNGSPSMAHQAQHAGPAQHHAFHMRDSNPYFSHPIMGAYGASPASSPLSHATLQQQQQQPERAANQRPSQAFTPATMRSAPSAASTGGFPFAGTSPNEFPYTQQLQERFPFNTETHAATAIRG